jgi:Uma2 family endonuclease
MASRIPRGLQEVRYEAAAQEYLRNLPLEHFMEASPQATQREITLESLALVRARRSEVHVFNELLVQWARPGERKPGQVCPDNMVVISKKPPHAISSYNVPLEPALPFWTLEYVSKSNRRKAYDDNFDKYEKELKVPYYLTFYPDNQELTLYQLKGKKYVSVKPNRHGRYAIAELELEVALRGGWVRFWYQGELLPLPADLQRELDETRARADAERRRADAEQERADAAQERATREQERADAAQERATQEQQRAEELQRRLQAAERELAQLRGGGQAAPYRRSNGTRRDK